MNTTPKKGKTAREIGFFVFAGMECSLPICENVQKKKKIGQIDFPEAEILES